MLPDPHARIRFLDEEAAHSTMTRLGIWISLGEYRKGIPVLRVGNEHLGAAYNVLFTVLCSVCLDVLDIAAGLRLSERQAASEFSACQPG